jgi:hypothetical protein
MAKFIVIDANGLKVLFSGNNLSFVKPNCKKINSPKQTNKTFDFSQADLSASQIVMLSSICTSQFQFEFFSWETSISRITPLFDEHFSSLLSYRYLDNDSPPPRYV